MTRDGFIERRTAVPQQRRSEKRGDSYVDAAREIVLAEGSDALTTNAVGLVVGGSPTAIYRYFSDRVELLDAVIAREHERLEALFATRVRSGIILTERDVLDCAVLSMVELRLSASGSLPLALNSHRQKSGQDHISRFVWSIVTRVFQVTRVNVDASRIRQYEHLVTILDAVLVGSTRSASRPEREKVLARCHEFLDLVCNISAQQKHKGAA